MKRLFFILLAILMSMSMIQGASANDNASDRVKAVLKKVSPSIVKVVAESGKIYVGTGIALTPNLVLTSALLTRNPDARLTVEAAGKKRFAARMRGMDSETSVALLELKSGTLPPIQTEDAVEVGDWVALVGAFYEQFPAIQQGVVSSVNENAVIINAAAVPGSAGGAVVNEAGKLIAVIRGRFGFAMAPDLMIKGNSGDMEFRSSKARSGELCFAVPTRRVREVSRQLEKFGEIRRGWMGLFLTWSRPDNTVRVSRVVEDSPAFRGGLRMNDQVLSVNGHPVNAVSDIFHAVRGLSPGDTLKIEVQRNRVRKSMLVTMGIRPEIATDSLSTDTSAGVPLAEEEGFAVDFRDMLPRFHRYILQSGQDSFLGIEFRSVTRTNGSDRQETPQSSGLLVTGVLREGPAARAGLRRGDRIVSIGTQEVTSPDAVRKAVRLNMSDGKVDMEIRRRGELKKLQVAVDPAVEERFVEDRFRNQMKGMSVEIHDRSLREIHKKIDQINWQIELLERRFRDIDSADLTRMITGLKTLEARAQAVLKRRENQLKSESRELKRDFSNVHRRLEAIRKTLQRDKK